MSSIIKKFARITENEGLSIEEVEIPSDIKGDEEAELLYVRGQEAESGNGSGAIWLSLKDVWGFRDYMILELSEDEAEEIGL